MQDDSDPGGHRKLEAKQPRLERPDSADGHRAREKPTRARMGRAAPYVTSLTVVLALIGVVALGNQVKDLLTGGSRTSTTAGTAAKSTPTAPATTAPPTTTPTPAPTTSDALAEAPWAAPALPPAQAPPAALAAWSEAVDQGRPQCPLLTLRPGGALPTGTPRQAAFFGGWGVAWDVPGAPGSLPDGQEHPQAGRSTYGVGTGPLDGAEFDESSPYYKQWSDGSVADAGPASGSRKWVAGLRVAGSDCYYQVWSYLGRDHLEGLIESLRKVDTSTL